MSNGGALPLREEAGACVADVGTMRPDDGGVASVVGGLANWTTLGGRTADGSPGTEGDGTEIACCST